MPQIHHLGYGEGEKIFCPHCKKEILMFQYDIGDSDYIITKIGKDFDDITKQLIIEQATKHDMCFSEGLKLPDALDEISVEEVIKILKDIPGMYEACRKCDDHNEYGYCKYQIPKKE